MLEGLVVTETVPQRLLELGHGQEEAIVGGAAPEHLPEPLDHLQLGTIAGEWVQLQMRAGRKHGCDAGAPVPRGFVDHEHYSGIVRRGIEPRDVAQMACKRLLQIGLTGGNLRRDAIVAPFFSSSLFCTGTSAQKLPVKSSSGPHNHRKTTGSWASRKF